MVSGCLHWGVAGAGMMSHDFVTAVATLPASEHRVLAVAATNPDKVKDFASLHNIKSAYEGYDNLAKDKDVDIVYIGVITPQHFEVSKLMLEHGKHVLCEKPMCMNYKEAKSLIDIAKQKKLFFLEGVWSRFFPAYESLDKHIQSGSMGDVLQVNIQFGVPISEKERLSFKELGGGTVLDLGVYGIQLAQLVFKADPEKVVCGGHLGPTGADESMSCVLAYTEGRTATLTTHSRVLLANEAVIVGTKGTLKLKDFWAPTIFQASAADITEWDLPQGAHRFNFHNSAGLSYEAEECRKCIKSGLLESPKLTHSESLSLAKIEDTLRKHLGVVFPQD